MADLAARDPVQTVKLLLLDTQSQTELPTLVLALLYTERKKKERGGNKRPFDERTKPSPPLTLLPPSLPCPVELIWQRGGSISQFTQAACSFFCAVPSTLLALPVSPPLLPLCSLLVCQFFCACVHNNCFIPQALGIGIICSTVKVKDSPTPEARRRLPLPSCAAAVSHQHRYQHLPSPVFIVPCLPSGFVLCEQRREKINNFP